MTEFELHLEDADEVLIARIEGELDFSNGDVARARIAAALNGDHVGLALDLTDIAYIDSAGVRLMYHFVRAAESSRQWFAIILPEDSPFRSLLRVTDLHEAASIYSSRQELKEGINANPR